MSTAGDISDLNTALALFQAESFDPASIVKLLTAAMLRPIVVSGRAYASYDVNGRSVRLALSEARELRKMFQEEARDQDGYDCVGVDLG